MSEASPPTTLPETRRVDPRNDVEWADLARRHGSLFSSPPWLRTLGSAFGLDLHADLTTAADGTLHALPYAVLSGAHGPRRSSLPFSDYCDALTNATRFDWSSEGAALAADDVPYSIRLRVTDDDLPDPNLHESDRFAWHAVDLERPLETIWSAVAANARQGVRRAQREDAVATIESTPEAIDEFRMLHVRLRREKYHMLAQPPEFFTALTNEFGPSDIAVACVRSSGVLVSGILLLRWADVAYYKFNASTPDGLALHANDLCMWTAIEFARDQWGCRSLDLGASDLDQPGLLRYKQKYATTTGELVRYTNGIANDDPVEAEFRSMLDSLVAILTADNVPERVGVDAASILYRHFR
jgi:Acetyltransferase (GNAT) domain